MIGPFMYRTRCHQLAQATQGSFLYSLKPVVPFINITETITLRCSSLEPLSKLTCLRLFQKRAERQKTNFSKESFYPKQKPNLSDSSFKYKTVYSLLNLSGNHFIVLKVVIKKESTYCSGYSRVNRGEFLAQKGCKNRT